MMRHWALISIICILFIIIPSLKGQIIQAPFVLNKIKFKGLKKTKTAYLAQILQSKINQAFQLSAVETDVQNLKNLAGIAQATYALDTTAQGIQLTFSVEERATLLPVVNFGGIKGNFWFSVGAADNNLGGYGNEAFAIYRYNDGRHSGQIYFRNPRILNTEWGYSINLNKWASIEPLFFDEGSVQYLYDTRGIGISVLKNFGLHHQLELGETFFVEKYKQAEKQILSNPPGPKQLSIGKLLTKFIYKQNYLNYDYFYLKGFESLFTYQNVYNIADATWFNSLQVQGKLFLQPQPKLNIALRLVLAVSTNQDSPFAPFVADSHLNIRGIGNRVDRGTAQIVLNAEGRYTVFQKNNWSAQMLAFSDLGALRMPGAALPTIFKSTQFRHFIGGGFRVHYQKIFGATLRVDYGFDIYNAKQGGFVLGLGQYF